MSSDEYFDDDDDFLDSSFINAVDAIEAAHNAASTSGPTTSYAPPKTSPRSTVVPKQPKPPSPKRLPAVKATSSSTIELDDSSDYGFDDFPVDDTDLALIDQACQRELDDFQRQKGSGSAQLQVPPPNGNALARRPSKGAQLTLFGEVAQKVDQSKASERNTRTFQRTRSTLRQMPLPGQAKKSKQWDRTAYAKTGWRKPRGNADKGKAKVQSWDSDGEEEEAVEFEQFPAPEIQVGPAPAMKLRPDRLASKTWMYPLNKPKRDYQYNIVKNCLLENTLVALPTGLGKTFIAGVVMLNFYHWFPEGKVVFVAPTKPLVAQQIDACHKTCGIPGSVAAELTGNVTKDRRIDAWRNKRVFYATPQTLLNDLINGHVDAMDLILIVIDEAHRGTGDYAYAQVVRYMMQHNPHFRILALTATPGGKPEVVQEIVDALHISHIEIRSESDPDLKKYLHTKFEQEHFVGMTDDIAQLRDALAGVIVPILKKVQSAGFLKNGNVIPTMLHPFRCQATLGEMSKAKAAQWAISAAAQLGPLTRAMGYLLENSISMCYGFLKAIADGTDDSNSKKAIRKLDAFKNLMKKFEEQASRGFVMHPKMDVLRTLLIDHFAKTLPEDGDSPDAQRGGSRAMVFVSFRECVEEIVELLNKESPIIRAKPFIGQGTDKQGKKGYAQKEQLEVIEQFKAGVYNVLVSTSIGEEGLDIGEVDLIVCYDAQKTPIRMLQRIGRTGRKASGSVHILLAQGREEHNWQKAQSNYAEVQHFIVRASDLEVYGDVDRLLPEDIEPECVEMEMEIEEYVREERASRKGSLATEGQSNGKCKKRKRDDNPLRNVPESASKGFVSVSQLLVKGGAKRKKKVSIAELARAAEDDSDDEEIEAGVFGPRRTKSASAAGPVKGKKKALARSATTASSSKKAPAASKKAKQATLTQLGLTSSDDSDDEDIERGLSLTTKPTPPTLRESSSEHSAAMPGFRPARELGVRSSSPDIPLHDSVIDLTDTPDPPQARCARAMLSSSPDRPPNSSTSQGQRRKRIIASSSPERTPSPVVLDQGSQPSDPGSSSNPPDRSKSPSLSRSNDSLEPGNDSMAWLIEDDDDPIVLDLPEKLNGPRAKSREPLFLASSPVRETSPLHMSSDDEPVFLDELSVLSPRQLNGDAVRSPRPSGPLKKTAMGPPALPARITNASPSFSDDLAPDSTFAVRVPGKHPRKRLAVDALEIESSPPAPPSSQRRLQRERPPSPSPAAARPPPRKKHKFKDIAHAQKLNPWIDVEATHSGDEMSGGSSDPETVLDSDDRKFFHEPGGTQMSPSYDQSAVYRQSLLTQAPGGGGPLFKNRPVRRGQAAFGPVREGSGRYPHMDTSSPTREDDEPDEYMLGSFVVDDDADISFANGPSSDE